jgi:hypothetical protein
VNEIIAAYLKAAQTIPPRGSDIPPVLTAAAAELWRFALSGIRDKDPTDRYWL